LNYTRIFQRPIMISHFPVFVNSLMQFFKTFSARSASPCAGIRAWKCRKIVKKATTPHCAVHYAN